MKLRLAVVFFTIFLFAGCDGDKTEPEKTTVSTPTPTTPTPQTDKQTGTQSETKTNPTRDLGLEDVTKSQEEFIPATNDDDDNPEAVSEEELEASSEQIEEEFTQNDPEIADDDPEGNLEDDDPEIAEDVVNPQEVPEQSDVVNPEEPDKEFVNPEE